MPHIRHPEITAENPAKWDSCCAGDVMFQRHASGEGEFGPWHPGGMRALVITGPGSAQVSEVDDPLPGAGQVVVDVRRAGICGTDVELFTGQLAYFGQGKTRFPVRPGHEWCWVVSAVGAEVPAWWLGVRVTGDTMLGCGQYARCRAGRRHVCADRFEVGIMCGWPEALAGQVSTGTGTKIHINPGA
jgi:D-arabinose 1-dehydrogenase-like Zn-dependent alcohol dehydrogenase